MALEEVALCSSFWPKNILIWKPHGAVRAKPSDPVPAGTVPQHLCMQYGMPFEEPQDPQNKFAPTNSLALATQDPSGSLVKTSSFCANPNFARSLSTCSSFSKALLGSQPVGILIEGAGLAFGFLVVVVVLSWAGADSASGSSLGAVPASSVPVLSVPVPESSGAFCTFWGAGSVEVTSSSVCDIFLFSRCLPKKGFSFTKNGNNHHRHPPLPHQKKS